MIQVTHDIFIDERELSETFVRSSGPGGQNVNKVSTAVQLRFNVRESRSLPEDVRKRLIKLVGSRLTSEGELIIDSRRSRKQERNREDALNRLIQFIRQAARKPKARHKTKPSFASRQRRMDSKRQRGNAKKLRQRVTNFE